MLPVRDHNPSERTPYVTYWFLAINTLVFVLMALLDDSVSANDIYISYGVVPFRLSQGDGFGTILTSMFIHGGFLHFAGNMLFLWIFGDNLESTLGHIRFLLFYFASGVCAALAQYLGDPESSIPIVGASGAIAGVMGGYLLLFPKARVDVLFIIFFFVRIVPLPAWLMLLIWFGLQLINSAVSMTGQGGGVAYLAHAGGFVAGFLMVVPIWVRLGARDFWTQSGGHPHHPEARYRITKTDIPTIRRRK